MEAIIENGETTMKDLNERVGTLEDDVRTIKNNWKWVVTIVGVIGSFVGSLVFSAINAFLK